MKKALLILLLFCAAEGCKTAAVNGRSTANLTTPGVVALQTVEVVKVLDIIRDTAVDGEARKVIATPTATKIVEWHRAALLSIKELPLGWKPTVLSSLSNLKQTLTPSEVNIVGPYIDSAVSIIRAVIQ